jgi:hypothetical protein
MSRRPLALGTSRLHGEPVQPSTFRPLRRPSLATRPTRAPKRLVRLDELQLAPEARRREQRIAPGGYQRMRLPGHEEPVAIDNLAHSVGVVPHFKGAIQYLELVALKVVISE